MSEKKVVLVTGCSSGFGKAVCEELSKKGYDVVATARKKEQLSGIPARLKAELDVSSTESIQTAISQIVNELGHIDILINNAGFSVRSAIEEIDEQKLYNMYEVNVFGLLKMMQAVLPVMRRQESGRILNVGSISGRMTGIANGGYCSTKYAVEALTEAARYEVSEFGIEVAVIEPGAMDTSFFHRLAKNSDEGMKNPDSPYRSIYERDLKFRSQQSKSDVNKCAARLVTILGNRKLKVRYTIGVSPIFRLFVHMPDRLKEWGIRKFN